MENQTDIEFFLVNQDTLRVQSQDAARKPLSVSHPASLLGAQEEYHLYMIAEPLENKVSQVKESE